MAGKFAFLPLITSREGQTIIVSTIMAFVVLGRGVSIYRSAIGKGVYARRLPAGGGIYLSTGGGI